MSRLTEVYIDQPSVEDTPAFYAPWHVRLGQGEISPRRLFCCKRLMQQAVLAKPRSKLV